MTGSRLRISPKSNGVIREVLETNRVRVIEGDGCVHWIMRIVRGGSLGRQARAPEVRHFSGDGGRAVGDGLHWRNEFTCSM